jgi:quercetin dioxygenase-like cupin family protein
MTIKERIFQQREGEGMLDGKGKYVGCQFFQEDIDPTMLFAYMMFEPGAYAGYHQHDEHDSILYILSGTGEHYQDGERFTLECGDVVLVKSGHAHAVRNTGDRGLEAMEFLAHPGGEHPWGSTITSFSLPEAIADWE